MEHWKKERTRIAWSLAWVFAVLVHRLLLPYVLDLEFETRAFLITTIYFGILTYLVTWALFIVPSWLVAVFLFIFGAAVELFIFQVIFDPILAGLFYVAMIFIPRWVARRMFAAQIEKEASKAKKKS